MQFTTTTTTTLLLSALSLLPTTLATSTAHIHNNCAATIYYQSNLDNKVHTLAHGGVYSEPMTRSGSAVKMGWYSALSAPLTFEYTPSNGLVYYDLSNNAGNPFATYRNELVTSVAGCTEFNCAPNDAGCYSKAGALKIGACNSATDVTVTVCA